jgi:hypothetical protein
MPARPGLRLTMVAFATLIGISAATARAANVETLLMPGKLTGSHAKLEENCGACHDKTDRMHQTPLCLECHKDIANDLNTKHGLHGRMANADKSQCRACHTDHKGRDGDIVNFTPGGFDHSASGFPLSGAHVGLSCNSCHAKNAPYRKAASECVACHRSQDVHKGTLGEACAKCHRATAWSEVRFDHDKTLFPLREAHAKLECDTCHFGPRYRGTPRRCSECHAPDDVHKGSRGEDCAKCHTTANWKSAKFDHAKETGFALNGAHADVDCAACHTTGKYSDKLPKDCHGCHRAQDAHAGRFGEDCAHCHLSSHWKPVEYDHTPTHFALLGAHARLQCHDCHSNDIAKQKLGTTCGDCHRPQDPHGGALGGACDKCHNNETWYGRVRFDHDLSNYPLLGQHVLASCAQCHSSLSFKGTAAACIACHRTQDVHKGGLGEDCAACHSPNGWKLWSFDHSKETKFELTGAHRKLSCNDCHRDSPNKVKLATDCASCHEKDDLHVGDFGRQCQRCHNTLSFSAARIH